MRRPRPLPEALQAVPLSAALLAAHGIPRRRLLCADIIALGSGIYLSRALGDGASPEELYRYRALGLGRSYPSGWLSHSTVARLAGVPLPTWYSGREDVHISVPPTSARPRRDHVRGHQTKVPSSELRLLHGVRATSPAMMFLEIAQQLERDDLVAVGDHLVRQPRPGLEHRSAPYVSLKVLREVVQDARRVPGRGQAAEALSLVRVGSDSRAETRLRLAVLRHGLPEPTLQVPALPGDPRSPIADGGYPQWGLAFDYDGALHFTAERARYNQRRRTFFRLHGWELLQFNLHDYREEFTTAVCSIGAALADRWQRGEP